MKLEKGAERRMDLRGMLGTTMLLATCGGEKRPEAAPPADNASASTATTTTASFLLLCGADTVSVRGSETEVELNAQGETFALVHTPSASGAKYKVAGDSTTFYWNHGATSLVQVRGDRMPECETVP